MLTKRQQTVYNWINDNRELPVYAEAYKGAIEQLNNKSSGYITFVSHAGRDLMNLLASAVKGTSDVKGIKGGHVQYEQLVDKFKDDWKDEWGGEGFNTRKNNNRITHPIPNEICKKIKVLVDEHKVGNLRAEDKGTLFFTILLDYSNKESVPENLFKEWRTAKKCFEKYTHLRKKGFSMEVPDEVERHFQNLDNLLYAAAASEIEQLRNIHEILDEANR